MDIRCTGWNSIYKIGTAIKKQADFEYMLLLIRSRSCIAIDGAEMHLPANTLILCSGRHEVECSADECAMMCDWICFDAGDEQELMESLEPVFDTPVRFADTEFICGLMRNISEEFYSLGARRLKMLDSLMRILLIKISDGAVRRDMSVQTTEPHYGLLIELREKIYRNPQMKWNVDTMAAYVNMSRSYFQHIYRETFGVSCIADVISGKIEKAKEILSETGCTVSQVAAMCGYDNEEHFMRQFKKNVGVTPTKYRKQL